jgi:hypothetical protein
MTPGDDPRLAPFIKLMAEFIAEQVRRDLAQQQQDETQTRETESEAGT